MGAMYYKSLLLLGINQCIVRDFVTDYLVTKLFYIQCKWGFKSAMGTPRLHTNEAFLIELGLYDNVLSYSYYSTGYLATDDA